MVKIELELTDEEYLTLLKNLDVAGYVYAHLWDFVDEKYKPKADMINHLMEKFFQFSDDEIMKNFFRKDLSMLEEEKYKKLIKKWDVRDDVNKYDKYVVRELTGIDLDEEDEIDEESEVEKDEIIKKLLWL